MSTAKVCICSHKSHILKTFPRYMVYLFVVKPHSLHMWLPSVVFFFLPDCEYGEQIVMSFVLISQRKKQVLVMLQSVLELF